MLYPKSRRAPHNNDVKRCLMYLLYQTLQAHHWNETENSNTFMFRRFFWYSIRQKPYNESFAKYWKKILRNTLEALGPKKLTFLINFKRFWAVTMLSRRYFLTGERTPQKCTLRNSLGRQESTEIRKHANKTFLMSQSLHDFNLDSWNTCIKEESIGMKLPKIIDKTFGFS